MTRVSASAPGKVILFGEHAVVYGQPAVAVPVHAVESSADLEIGATGAGLTINLVNLGSNFRLADCPESDPIGLVIRLTLKRLGLAEPDGDLSVSSTVPMASGLGSGASVSAAISRVIAALSVQAAEDSMISEIVFEAEKIHHGMPSGIDNAVICYDRPIYFVKGSPPAPLDIGKPFDIVIADTGVPSPTKDAVASVRALYEYDTEHTQQVLQRIGQISRDAASAIAGSNMESLATLMNRNHQCLQELGVSSPELEHLVNTALSSGASGAKLSGGGRGGNMIALAPTYPDSVMQALTSAGARQVWLTTVD